jgi:hypothetical protein
MARPPSPHPRPLVEDCEVICVSTAVGNLAIGGISFDHTRGGRGGQRRWFRCPRCGRRMFKLYRPPGSPFFACRQCHELTYRCVQQHDARLDWLVKAPDWLLMHYMKHGKGPWPLLACRAAYVKLDVTGKY